MMNGLLAVLGLVGPLALIIATLVIALLSQRLGTITKQLRVYRWLFVAIGVMTVAVVIRFWALDSINGLAYPLLMALGLTIALVVAWHYWGWLLGEREYHQTLTTHAYHADERTSQ